ncbi:hypothetical protein ACWEGQ_35025 [Streptomyces seoulensis]
MTVTTLLAAFAGGAGGEAGKRALQGALDVVRRPFQRPAHLPTASSGEAELVALEEAPDDPALGQQLSIALGMRAALDPEFAGELAAWQEEAKQVRQPNGDVVFNNINGGTFSGVTIQAGRVSNFQTPPGKQG